MTAMHDLPAAGALQGIQLEGLRRTLEHAYKGSPAYRAKLEAVGYAPGAVESLGDLESLPFTTAEDLKDGYPFPLLCVPEREVVRVHASSGTTGKRKVLAYTQRDVDDWAAMMARCYATAGLTVEDRVQIAVGYGVWTAGVGFQLGCERFGAMALPTGPGNRELQCQFLEDFGATVFCSTSSMALLMAEEVARRGLRDRIKLKKIIYGSERTSEAMRRTIGESLGAELFDITGLTELYGPGTGLECSAHKGIHYWADYYILEILDPETLTPVAPGETGEMVVTTLRKQAAPLIRYRTRDLCRLIPGPCACGNPMPRHDRLLGRSDDVIKFRAVNIYPGQVDHILSATPGAGSEYQMVLEHHQGKDTMTVRVERAAGAEADGDVDLAKAVARAVKNTMLVSVEVEILDPGALPRTERKSQRVFDNRY